MTLRNRLCAGVAMIALYAASAAAHHSFVVLFDPSQTIEVAGVVTEFQFIAPHAYIRIEAAGENGDVEQWELETTSPGQLIREGLTPEVLRPGDAITAVGNPTRDGRRLMRLLTITLPSGEKKQIQ